MDSIKKPPSSRSAKREPSSETGVGQTISKTTDALATRGGEHEFFDDHRYSVEGEFARGGLGRILKARDTRLDRLVAVKELLRSNDKLRDRFQREVEITARLQHPGIVPLYDAGVQDDGEPYYIMKLLSGGRTLKEAVAEAGDLNGRLALLPNLIAAADAIAYAHSVEIIHRDLKPANVLLGPFGETVVIDWGLAKDLSRPPMADDLGGAPYRKFDGELTQAGSVMGTPQYMPPEQARGEPVDKQADVYALGAILYQILAGHSPYAGASSADVLELVLREPPRVLSVVQPGIPTELDAIVTKSMSRDPAARYRDASELAADLHRFEAGQLVRAHAYSRSQLLRRWLRQNRTAVVLSSAFALTLGILGTLSLRQIVSARDRAEARSSQMILLQARALLDKDPTASLAWLKTYPPSASDWPAAREIIMNALNAGVSRHLAARDDKWIPLGGFSRDGRWFVSKGKDHRIEVWDVGQRKVVASVRCAGHPSFLKLVEDDKAVLFGEENRLLRWQLGTGRSTSRATAAGL
jgi:serine/threonine protein kinase